MGDAEPLAVVTRNVACLVRPPTCSQPDTVTWTAEELGQFLEFVESDRLRPALYLLATTGMRRGQVLGLRWDDVDRDDGWLSVEQTITTVSDQLVVGPVKAPRSRLRITLDPATVAARRRHRALHAEERLAGSLFVRRVAMMLGRRSRVSAGSFRPFCHVIRTTHLKR